MNVYLPYTARLPSAYQEVEYIQSSGTQYIVTSIIPSNTKGIYIKLSSQDIDTDLLYVGSKKTWDTRFWIWNSTNSSWNLYLWWNTNDRWVISVNTIFEAKLNYLNSRGNEVNWTVVASNLWTLSSSNNIPITIFAWNENWTIIAPSKIKLYSCKISDWSDIVNNFIPCYRKSDSVIWLYDLVNSAFYTNSWTGTFSKGNDVTMAELKNAYIGEYVEEVYTITGSSVPNDNSNVYKSIAKSWYTIQSVTIEISADNNGITTSSYRTVFCRLSWSNNTTHRYWLWFFFYDAGNENTLKIVWRKDNNSDVTFQTWPSLTSNWYNNAILTINRDWATRTVGWVSYSRTYTASEKSIVETVLNTWTTNFYVSRVWGVTISNIVARVRYTKN